MREILRGRAGLVAALAAIAWGVAGAPAATRGIASAQETAQETARKPAEKSAQERSPAREVQRRLQAREEDPDVLAAALIELGPAALEFLVDARRDRTVLSGDSLSRVALTPPKLLAVSQALAALPHPQLVAALSDRAARSAESNDRRVVIELLGELGGIEDVELLLGAATPPQEGPGFDSGVTHAVQQALVQLFARVPAALEPAARRLPNLHGDVAPALARAIAEGRAPTSFDLLVRALDDTAHLDLVVFPLLARAEGRHTSPKRERVFELVRERVGSTDPMLARTAARLCGELGDTQAASVLCDALDSPDAQLAAASHASLKQFSGLGFPAQRARWKQWLDSEEAWRRSECEQVLEQLRSRRDDVVIQALQTLAQHPLYRDLLAPSVAEVARRPEPNLRVVACTVLGRLPSSSSIATLSELARDPQLNRLAHDALRAIDPSLIVPTPAKRAVRAQRK